MRIYSPESSDDITLMLVIALELENPALNGCVGIRCKLCASVSRESEQKTTLTLVSAPGVLIPELCPSTRLGAREYAEKPSSGDKVGARLELRPCSSETMW